MKRVKIGPGVWSVGPLGEIEVTAEIRRQYIEAGLTPPKLVDDKVYPARPAGEPQIVRTLRRRCCRKAEVADATQTHQPLLTTQEQTYIAYHGS